MIYYRVLPDGTKVLSDGSGIVDDVEVVVANKTLRVEDSGKTFSVATDSLIISLPATIKGLEYTFVNSGAAGNNIIAVSPVAADGIAGTITLAAAVVTLTGTLDQDLINVKGTSTLGNTITIVGTGITGSSAWLIKYSTGIWA